MTPAFRVEGIIGEGQAKAEPLAAFLGEHVGPVEIVVNSPGGDAFEGAALMAEIERHGAVTVIGRGIVASAATLPFVAAAAAALHPACAFMIHDPSGMTIGTAAAHRQNADTLDGLARIYGEAYARFTGHPVARVLEWMRAETWLSADEAVALHFADRIETAPDPAPVALALGHFDLRKFSHPPAELLATGTATVSPKSSNTEAHNGA